jgi:ABC-type glutathione transport system ATPase component
MIRVDDLTFAYTGAEKPAVRNLSFAIETGEVFGSSDPVAPASRRRRRS